MSLNIVKSVTFAHPVTGQEITQEMTSEFWVSQTISDVSGVALEDGSVSTDWIDPLNGISHKIDLTDEESDEFEKYLAEYAIVSEKIYPFYSASIERKRIAQLAADAEQREAEAASARGVTGQHKAGTAGDPRSTAIKLVADQLGLCSRRGRKSSEILDAFADSVREGLVSVNGVVLTEDPRDLALVASRLRLVPIGTN